MQVVLDATVLTDLLLKTKSLESAKQLLAGYERKLLLRFAIKEFEFGPLRGWLLLHRYLSRPSKTYADLLARVAALSSGEQRKLLSTVLEAWKFAEESCSPQLRTTYHGDSPEVIRYWLQRKILQAWKNHAKVADEVTAPIPCYPEMGPQSKGTSGGPRLERSRCLPRTCEYAAQFAHRQEDLAKLIGCLQASKQNSEGQRRLAALVKLSAGAPLTDSDCRRMGDAYYALAAPPGFTILTTNIGDHSALASALGIDCKQPNPWIPRQ